MQLKIVPDVISGQDVAMLEPTASVRDAAHLMAERRIGAVPIVHAGKLEGIFTERDVSYRVVAPGLNPDTTPLREVMTANPVVLRSDDTVLGAMQSIHEGDFRHLPVLEDNRLVGIVSVRDIFACAKQQRENEYERLQADVVLACKMVPDLVSGQNIATLEPNATVREAAQLMAIRHIGAILVTHDDVLKGIFTERDVSLRVIAAGLDSDTLQLGEVMTADPVTLKPGDEARSALQNMLAGDYRHVPVVDDARLVGIVSIRDIYGCVETQLEEGFRQALLDRARDMAADDS
jgi:CBS domain-containing protein